MRHDFSFFRQPLSNVTPDFDLSLGDVATIIRGEMLKANTEFLREYLKNGQEEQYKEKKRHLLPFATFGGTFDYRSTDQKKLREANRKGLLCFSQYVTIDIDHIDRDLPGLQRELIGDRDLGVRLSFISPSGNGLKLVCEAKNEINSTETYLETFDALRGLINSKYGDIVDKSGRDVTRACLLCHDKDCYLSEEGPAFDLALHPLPKKETKPRTFSPIVDFDSNGIEEIVRRVERSGIDIAPEYSDYFPLICSFASLGEEGRSLAHRVCSLSPKYKEADLDRDFDRMSKSPEAQHIGFFINLAKSNGIDVKGASTPVRLPKMPKKSKATDMNTADKKPQASEMATTEEELKALLTPVNLKELAKEKRDGICTRYNNFENQDKKNIPLVLWSGALTLICGKASHCKSKFLQNLALDIAGEIREGETVLFFSYEEELSEIVMQFANIATGEKFRRSRKGGPFRYAELRDNIEMIRTYYSSGEASDGGAEGCSIKEGDLPQYLSGLREFEVMISEGRLRPYYTEMESEKLCKVIEEVCSNMTVKAVFVDYAQLLYKSPESVYHRDRQEEIKEICNDLKKTAIRLHIPIVLGAQLNRQTPNPIDMSEDNVADSSNLTKFANTIVCLWNSAYSNMAKPDDWDNNKEKKELKDEGFEPGKKGKLLAKITKNRRGTPNCRCVLNYDGDSGLIFPGPIEDSTKKPQNPDLDF